MTKVNTARQARANIYAIIDETAKTHEPVLVTGRRNNIVMISQEDWSAIEETLYLNSIPNMALSIQSAMNDSNDVFSETIEW